jgi:UDP-N-acetylglucosamine acyltransferase
MVQGLTAVGKDVAPFTLVDQTNTARALNSVGLRRAGFSADQRRALSRAFKEIFLSDHSLANSIAEVASWDPIPEVREIIDFIQASKRGVCLGNRRAAAEMSEA